MSKPNRSKLDQMSPEEQVVHFRSLIMLRLAKMVEWPEEKFAGESTPVRIGVLGERSTENVAAFERNIRGLESKSSGSYEIQGRDVEVMAFSSDVLRSEAAGLRNLLDSHLVLVLDDSAGSDLSKLEVFKNSHVMTVGETVNFASKGGMVSLFYGRDGKPDIYVNHEFIKHEHIAVSAEFLRHAEKIVTGGWRDEE